MTREELKAHCKKEIEMCEFWAHGKDEELDNNKIYQEHKLILELLEQEESVLDKVKQAREEIKECSYSVENEIVVDLYNVLIILDKLIESEDKEWQKKEAETIILKHQFAFASMPDDVVEAINYLVKEEPRWIPCSERFPEENGSYIVTEKMFSIDDRKHEGRYQNRVEQVEYSNGKWQRASFFEVVAWKPLPKPYDSQESEDRE